MSKTRLVIVLATLLSVGLVFLYAVQQVDINAFTKLGEVNYRTLYNASRTAIHDLALRRSRAPTAAEADGLPRVLCWVMCDPNDLQKRVIHVNATWARHCDVTLYMSSTEDRSFPTIGLDVPPGKKHIGAKSKAAWTYIYHHYLDDADYFVKCDPDTFLVVPTLKRYLASRDPGKAEYFGHRFYFRGMKTRQYLYNSGGPGQVLSREAVKILVTQAFKMKRDCMPDGEAEDLKTSLCLTAVGGEIVDTRDSLGQETFMVFNVETYVNGKFPPWYRLYDADNALWGYLRKCCSDRPIGFHYISPNMMYVLYYMFYQVHGDIDPITDTQPLTFYNGA